MKYKLLFLTCMTSYTLEKIHRKHLDDFLHRRNCPSEENHVQRKKTKCKRSLRRLLQLSQHCHRQKRRVGRLCVLGQPDDIIHCATQKIEKKIIDSQIGMRGGLLRMIKSHPSGWEKKNACWRCLFKLGGVTYSRFQSCVLYGSVYRPLLFLIYINDLPKGLESHLNMFLDNAKVL